MFTPVGPYDLCLHFRELISDFLDWEGKQGQKSMAMHNELFLYSFQNSTCSSLTWLKQDSGWEASMGKEIVPQLTRIPQCIPMTSVYRNFDFSPFLWSLPYFYGKRFLWGKNRFCWYCVVVFHTNDGRLMGNFRSRFWPLKNTVSVNLLSKIFFSCNFAKKNMNSKNTIISIHLLS